MAWNSISTSLLILVQRIFSNTDTSEKFHTQQRKLLKIPSHFKDLYSWNKMTRNIREDSHS